MASTLTVDKAMTGNLTSVEIVSTMKEIVGAEIITERAVEMVMEIIHHHRPQGTETGIGTKIEIEIGEIGIGIEIETGIGKSLYHCIIQCSCKYKGKDIIHSNSIISYVKELYTSISGCISFCLLRQ